MLTVRTNCHLRGQDAGVLAAEDGRLWGDLRVACLSSVVVSSKN